MKKEKPNAYPRRRKAKAPPELPAAPPPTGPPAALPPPKPGSFRVQEICATYGMPRQALPRLSGFSQRAVDSWAAGKTPSAPAAKRLTELKRLFAALARLVEPSSIGPWLNQPNAAFDGSTPLQVIERGEGDRLWRMIYQLESGQPD